MNIYYFSIICLFVGVLIIFYQIYLLYKIHQSYKWPTAKAEIISSELEDLTMTNETDKAYRAKIIYKYSINGIEYCSKKIYWGDRLSNSSKKKTVELTKKYPKGNLIEIYYNPHNFSEAVIERKISSKIYQLIAVGLIIVIIGLYFIQK
jgi:hypothetical protein